MTFFYDRDCSFCRAAAGRLVRLAPLIDVAPLPLRHHAIFRAAGGDELGHRAIGCALAVGGRARWVRLIGRVLCLRPLDPLWGAGYRWVAANRARLPMP
ncbi:thiol-disulfide oxidoreductase DCC family protein [Corynebacterium comes]|uniref:DUF393 domain-containing protein n=1 Tax=Corynebacterium comes TaxID=2675218 RepID=A0A6B8W3E7_9CORY|nr:hypothetical protein [Corynebacterium comes]QGU05456.1 hypothetical protein CETAM_11110 [Corynebacterium comes]